MGEESAHSRLESSLEDKNVDDCDVRHERDVQFVNTIYPDQSHQQEQVQFNSISTNGLKNRLSPYLDKKGLVLNGGHVDTRGVVQNIKMRLQNFINAIRARIKQLSIVLIISITVLATLKHDRLIIRKTPPPSKFFSTDSLIEDYETGSFSELITRSSESDVSFTMYYAPWDAQCIKFKREFEIIASHYPNQIYFAAINCWWPDGECRQHNMIHQYPSFSAHLRNIGALTYPGPLMAGYIIHYLDNLIDPLTPIQDEGQLLDLISKHDGVAVGYFDFNDPSTLSSYDLFFKASVRALQSDPFRLVKFCVITSRKVAQKVRINTTSSINLYSWNTTSIVGTDFKNSDAVLKWIYSNLFDDWKGLVDWLIPSGRKSDALAEILESSPTLVLLTPRSLIFGISPYYDILREVAMDYHNCENSPTIKSLIHRSILRRRATEESLIEMEEKCHELMNPIAEKSDIWKMSNVISEDTCCHSQIVRWRPIGKSAEKKCYCTACIRINLSKCPSGCKKFNCLATVARYLNSFEPLEINKTASFCNEIKSTYQPKYTPYYKIEVTCSGNLPNEMDSHQYSLINDNRDDTYDSEYFSSLKYLSEDSNVGSFNFPTKDDKIVRMMKNLEHQYCYRLALGLNYSDFNFPDSGEGSLSSTSSKWRENFTGLGCKANKTLKFLAIDSILYPGFAESLGIDIFNETHATLAFIIESHQENIYLLNHQVASSCCSSSTINKRAFYEIIKNYTDNKLVRYLRSSTDKSVSSSEQCLKGLGNDQIICVPEIHSNNFKEIALSPKRDVLVMYFTPWCGYCSTVAHIYLSVAKYFQNIDGILFTRINGDTNDLPFEYNVDKYPTIMLFPAYRKSETVTFPSTRSITQSNLLGFILTYAQPSVKLQIALSLCDVNCLLRNWFNYQRHSTTLFKSYKNDLISLVFLRDKLSDLRKKQRALQQPFIDHYIANLRKKRSQFELLFNVKQFLVNRLSDISKKSADELIDVKKGQEWLAETVSEILRPSSQTESKSISKKSKSRNSSPSKSSKEDNKPVKKTKSKSKSKKDEL